MLVVVAVMALIAGLRAAREERPVLAVAAPQARDPELARCRGGGEAALADAACQQAWHEARERFLAGPTS